MTETATFSVNRNDVQEFERQVQSVTVSTGSLVITDNGKSTTVTSVSEGETFDAKNSTSLTILAVEASAYAVTFAENAVRPVFQNVTAGEQADEPVRGDAGGGSGGSFDSRTVKELQALAKERGLTVKGKKGKKPNKADFIKALRA